MLNRLIDRDSDERLIELYRNYNIVNSAISNAECNGQTLEYALVSALVSACEAKKELESFIIRSYQYGKI